MDSRYSGVTQAHWRWLAPLLALLMVFAGPANAGNGDVAPLGAPDGKVTIADALVTLRMALKLISEDLNADVAPLGAPDGKITVADSLVVLRAALQLVQIPSVAVAGQPSLGMVRRAAMTLHQADGTTLLGGGTTGTDGRVSIYHTGLYSGPVIVTVNGGDQAEYFDEASGTWTALAQGENLHALSPVATGTVAVTPLTEIAYRMALASNLFGNGASISAAAIDALNERVRNALAPELSDILTPPTLLDHKPGSGAGALGTGMADRYALRLAAMAQLAADQGSNIVQLMAALATDIVDDGQINRSGAASGAPYGPTFTTQLFAALGQSAGFYAGNALQQLLNAIDTPFDDVSPSVPFDDINNNGGTALIASGDGAALAGGRGVTGTVDGTTYTFTNPSYLVLPTNVALIQAYDGNDPLTRWTLGPFEPKLGRQPCGAGGAAPNVSLALNGVVYLADQCAIVVTSIGFDRIEGRFAATMKNPQGQVFATVTDGYFRYHPPGVVSYDFGTVNGLPVLDAAAGSHNAYVWRSNHPSQGVGAFSFDMARSGNQGTVTGLPQAITTNEPLGAPFEIAGDLTDIYAAGFLAPSGFTGGAYRFTFVDISQGSSSPNFVAFIHPTGLITGTYTDATGSFDFTNSTKDRYATSAPAELTGLAGSFEADGYFFIQGPLEFRIAANGDVSYTDPASCTIKTIPWDGNGDYLTRYENGGYLVRMDDGSQLINFFVDGRGIWEFRIGESNGTQIYRTKGPSSGTFGDYGLSLCQAQAGDTTPPVFNPFQNITLNATDANGTPRTQYTVSQYLGSITATDTVLNWSYPASVTNDAPAILPIGPTVVTFTATDTAGNQATAQATITIADVQGPVIAAPQYVTLAALDGSGVPQSDSAVQGFINGISATDNVDGPVAVTHNIPTQLHYGNNTVKFFASDAAGNASEQQTIITVLDQSPPVLTPPNATAVAAIDASGTRADAAGVLAFIAALGATDNVDSRNALTIAHDVPATLAIGPHTVTFTVTDRAGNSASTSAVLTVADLTPPVVSLIGAPRVTVLQNGSYQEQGATAIDNIDGDLTASIVITGTVDTSVLGEQVLTYSVSDAAGNPGSVQRVVAITDQVPPPPWAMISPPLSPQAFNRVTYTGSRFVAVGNGGTVITSTDGSNWVQRNSGVAVDLRDVIWDGARLIAVGGDGTGKTDGVLISSADGITWGTPITFSQNTLYSIAYGNGTYLAADMRNKAWASSDLSNWAQANVSPVYVPAFQQIAFDTDHSRFVGTGGTVGTTTDTGVNWTIATPPSAQYVNAVLVANGKTLLAGPTNRMFDYSALNFTTVRTATNPPAADYQGLCWDGQRFVLVGTNGAFYTSASGADRDWTRIDTGFPSARYSSVACSAQVHVAVGKGHEVVSTNDLSTFVNHNPAGFSGGLYAVTHANGIFLVQTGDGLFASSDGRSWTKTLVSGTYRIVSDGNLFYRYHYINVSNATLFTSSDGVNWSGATALSAMPLVYNALYTELNGNPVWVYGIYGDGLIRVSFDQGGSWSSRNSGTSSGITNVVKVGNQLIALGESGKLATSSDGQNWTLRTTDTTWRLTDAATDGTTIIAVGYNPTWTSTTGYQSVILRSGDGGTTWSKQEFSGRRLIGVEFATTHWVVTSDIGDSALASTDGNLWSPIGGGFPFSGNQWTEMPKINGKVYVFGTGYMAVINP